jgi:hypothetical protein
MRGIGELPMPLPPSNGHKTTQENG